MTGYSRSDAEIREWVDQRVASVYVCMYGSFFSRSICFSPNRWKKAMERQLDYVLGKISLSKK